MHHGRGLDNAKVGVSTERGRTLHASCDMPRGAEVVQETPLIAMALPDSARRDRCLAPLSTLSAQLQHVAGLSEPPWLPLADDDDGEINGNVRCRQASC